MEFRHNLANCVNAAHFGANPFCVFLRDSRALQSRFKIRRSAASFCTRARKIFKNFSARLVVVNNYEPHNPLGANDSRWIFTLYSQAVQHVHFMKDFC